MIKSHTKEALSANLKKLIQDNTSLKILQKSDKVFVNNKTIQQTGDHFVVDNAETFYKKKSAVAYAVCLENKNAKLAHKILRLDSSLGKLYEDYFWYAQGYKTTKNKIKKINLYNRLSDIKPKLKSTKQELDLTLKTVKIA